MQKDNERTSEKVTKKSYSTPVLTDYGDVTEITQGSAGPNTELDGSAFDI